MFRKIFQIALPLVLVGLILLIAYNTYQKTHDTTQSPITIIPTGASIILQLNDVKHLSQSLKRSNICSKLQNVKEIKNITQEAEQIRKFFIANQATFTSNSILISLHKISPNKIAALYSTSINRQEMQNDKEIISQFTNDIITSEYDNQTIYNSESLNRYFSFKDDILFYSNDKMLITDAIRTSNANTDNLFTNPMFLDCYSTISNSADINLMINYNNLFDLSNIFTISQSALNHFSEWTATDLKIKDNAILAAGLSAHNSSVNNFTDIFKNQTSQNLNILDIIPENTSQLFAISFNNQKEIYEKKNELLRIKHEFRSWNLNRKWIKDSSNVNYNEFINEINNEAGIFNTSSSLRTENTYTYFNTKESIRASSLLQGLILSSSDYRDFRINKIIDNNIVANLFGELFKTKNTFFTTINDYFIIGNSEVSLEYIIDNYISSNVLSENKSFKKANSYISKDANIFFYLNPGNTINSLRDLLIDTELFTFNADSIDKFTSFTCQINTSKNRMYHNICLFYDDQYRESIKEEWYYPLDTSSAIIPQFVDNHFTKEKMILVQDHNNNLIALNTSGEMLWSKQISNRVLGKINFLDAYNNNKFQAVFNTSNELHLIDRNGRFVDGFPKSLPTSTSMGHSLIDYDRNKNYRIIITGDNNKLYNIDKQGNNIDGWKYTKSTNRVVQIPIHFVVEGKDYILNATNNSTTKLLARNGTDRTTFEEAQSFIAPVNISSDGSLYSITSENKLWTANVNGTTKISELTNLQKNSKLLAYKDGYYVANQNTISYIDDAQYEEVNITLDSPVKSLSLIEGYIAITTNSSLYLIKDNEIIEGFPIDSEGKFNISDIDNDGKINVVNIKNGLIYNYELSE